MPSAEAIVDSIWENIQPGMQDATPDDARGSAFIIDQVRDNEMIVLANMQTPVTIQRQSFVDVIDYLQSHNATESNPVRIGSNNSDDGSLDLCAISKAASNGTRVINYIATILLRLGIAGIGHNRPNTIWLI